MICLRKPHGYKMNRMSTNIRNCGNRTGQIKKQSEVHNLSLCMSESWKSAIKRLLLLQE